MIHDFVDFVVIGQSFLLHKKSPSPKRDEDIYSLRGTTLICRMNGSSKYALTFLTRITRSDLLVFSFQSENSEASWELPNTVLHHPTALLGSTLKCLRVLYHRYLITSCLIWQSFRLIYCKVVLIADVTVALIGTDLELIGNPFFQLGHVTDDPDHARIAFQSLQRLQCISSAA